MHFPLFLAIAKIAPIVASAILSLPRIGRSEIGRSEIGRSENGCSEKNNKLSFTEEEPCCRFLPAMTRIILQKKFSPASHEELLLAFQTLDTGNSSYYFHQRFERFHNLKVQYS
jgi:hypothetical protein